MCLYVGAVALMFLVTVVPAHGAAGPRCLGRKATIVGSPGSDLMRGTKGSDVIVGLGGRDRIFGRGGDDRLCGGQGNDRLSGGPGSDQIAAGDGANDVVTGGRGNDHLDGGPGPADTLDYSVGDLPPVEVFMRAGIARGQGTDEFDDFENITGTNGDDSIYGDDGANVVNALDGDDTMLGNGGPDFFLAAGGNDTVNGGPAPDIIDFFFSGAPGPVTVDLTAGTATGQGNDVLISIEGAGGSEFDDSLTGENSANGLFGFGGNDLLSGGPGNNDFLQGDVGDDVLDGGTGTGDTADYYSVADPSGPVQVDLTTGTATGQGADLLAAIDKVNGTLGDDSLTGDELGNTLFGFEGDDTILGLAGDDFLVGREGTDVLDGGEGSDDCVSGETNLNCEYIYLLPRRGLRPTGAWGRLQLLTFEGDFRISPYRSR
jgi:Ca2+-binding RTX toxin-like protein